ncbi:MAG: PKD domain-containing protein [Candidatus Pseudobacter hemicellulosilyticus]|uniref:PKD domain-containing protein n=1 Tax=Candidatus Pseudobacter hemicellulosilyticus TaxID=3121375 RepID=A0AAJ5WRS8_9BACT|nr:MAG: PKD domain-containing protein [Pseudobacter sp.]
MMRKFASLLCLLMGFSIPLMAAHIRGGEMYYQYLGPGSGSGSSRYLITLKLYIDCFQNSPGQLDNEVPFTIFDKATGQQVMNVRAPMVREQIIQYDPQSNPCITNAPLDVCYRLRYYSTEVTLNNSALGYMISFQRCCRIAGIQNLVAPSDNFGATYFCEIPGTNALPDAYRNSSPQFNPDDAIAVCFGSYFRFDFSAVDADRDPVTNQLSDSIVYVLCEGYTGGGPGRNSQGGSCFNCPSPDPAAPPNPATGTYTPISYRSPYTGSAPLGLNASIDPKTGLLTGIAPSVEGQYVVTACAYEYRRGVLINIHHKDIHIRVADCIPLAAALAPNYSFCDDLLVTFRNNQVNPPGTLHIWDFGDGSKRDTVAVIDGETLHPYATAGSYTVKLIVVLAGQCIDSTTTIANVWPGFKADFDITGSCILLPIQFTDRTTASYGAASKWSWDFGDETSSSDISAAQHPGWKYGSTGLKTVRLIVESNRGCIDTIVKNNIEVKDRPTITLAFADTLICSNRPVQDTLQLHASGTGVFSWTPLTDILHANTPDPLVWPGQTTTYQVTLNENGCVNTAAVTVRTIDHVSLNAGPDSTICLTDTVRLQPVTDALYFSWTSNPASPISDPAIRNPLVSPVSASTRYTVTGSVGKCAATDSRELFAVPYPIANAGPDTTICFDDTARLHGSMVASRFLWAPANTLSSVAVLDPLAFPRQTTAYIFRVNDVLGCPKSVYDTVIVTVRPEIHAFAGNDTSIVAGQPLLLQGRGAEFIEWTPASYLSDTRSAATIASLPDHFTYTMRAFTQEGCFDLDTINIRVFKTAPDIYVPNAFRPSGTQNNLLRPIPVGISRMDYFRVYNRWGQLVFQTTEHGKGWDGRLNGQLQSTGTFVWMVQGTDYTGKTISKKGSAVLIR